MEESETKRAQLSIESRSVSKACSSMKTWKSTMLMGDFGVQRVGRDERAEGSKECNRVALKENQL
jgi:hypothetical protein